MRKFTLLEFMVVIVVISILITMLLPALSRAREKTKRAVCLSNLNQCHKANVSYGTDSDDSLPPGNAVLDARQGVNSVYRVATKMAFGAAIPFDQGYLSSADVFYCPSWTHPYMKKNKRNGNGSYGGYTDEGYPKPSHHYMTSFNYRGVFAGEVRAPSLSKDDASVPYMGDHWCRDWGKYVHTRDGYNILYLGGQAKFNYDRSQTVFVTAVDQANHALQDQFWDTFFTD